MVKKILAILTTALCCVSCGEILFRESDLFVVKSVELNEYIEHKHKYRYKYYMHWIQKYHGMDRSIVEEVYYYSDEKFELDDTLRLFNTKDIKNGK